IARHGIVIGGPGSFTLSARNVDLANTLGLRSVGPLLNPALASTTAGGARLSLDLGGTLQMARSQISSLSQADIDVTADGAIYVGDPNLVGPYCPVGHVCAASLPIFTPFTDDTPRGIYSAAGGNVSVVASNIIAVAGSRIAAYDGGDVSVHCIAGDIFTGPGITGPGAQGFTVTIPYVDPSTGQMTPRNRFLFQSAIIASVFPGNSNAVGSIRLVAGGVILVGCDGLLQ